VLPHQLTFLEAKEKYVAIIGGYGAGKTLPACVLGLMLSQIVPGNIGLVCRRSYSKLHDSTHRIFLEILQRVGCAFQAREVRDGWPHRVILPNGSEIHFRETKDLGRFLGPEYGWFYVDEAAEEPQKTWTDLVGRLRLPQARRYLRGFVTSNPPHEQHWLAGLFGLTPGVIERGEGKARTAYRLIQVSSRANPYLPDAYVDDLRANNPESEVQRIVEGQYGFSYEGKAVYAPPFAAATHIADLEPGPFTVVRSWDFGWHSPAIVWSQFPQCRAERVHWHVLHEYKGQNIDAEGLAGVAVDETRRRFPNHPVAALLDCGDAAGAQISDKGPGPIIRLQRAPYAMRFKYRHIPNLDPGIALIRAALGAPRCPCGRPVFQVDRRCRHLISALAGGYHYPQTTPGRAGEPRLLKPVKDGFYDDLADALRYAAENYYRGLTRDPRALEILMADTGPKVTGPDPSAWSWMERAYRNG
jgi:hypothetical protein